MGKRLIRLHREGSEVWVAVDHVTTVGKRGRDAGTFLRLVGDESSLYVEEGVETVVRKIEAADGE